MYISKSTPAPQISRVQSSPAALIKSLITKQWFTQALKFVAVGGLNTLVDASVYFSLTHWVSLLAKQLTLAKSISYIAGTVNSFYWNKSWTFRSKASVRTTAIPFATCNLIGAAINACVMYLAIHMGFMEWLSFILATGAALIWNFTASRLIFSQNTLIEVLDE